MQIGEAIRQARKAKKWTLEELAFKVGTDSGNLSRLETGKQKAGQDLLLNILNILNIPLTEIIVNSSKASYLEAAKTIKKQDNNTISMPVLLDQNTIDNQFNVLVGIDMNIENLKKLVNFTDPNKLQPYSMPDDSMRNTFDVGDWLLIDKAITKIDKNGIYLINYLNEECVRRFQLSPTKEWLMIPDNSNYQTFPIKIEDLTIIGKIIYVWNGRRV